MATRATLRLRAIQPADRVHKPMRPSARRQRTRSKHLRRGMWPDGSLVLFHMTQRPPWTLRARRRLHERLAKASRRANRRSS